MRGEISKSPVSLLHRLSMVVGMAAVLMDVREVFPTSAFLLATWTSLLSCVSIAFLSPPFLSLSFSLSLGRVISPHPLCGDVVVRPGVFRPSLASAHSRKTRMARNHTGADDA